MRKERQNVVDSNGKKIENKDSVLKKYCTCKNKNQCLGSTK